MEARTTYSVVVYDSDGDTPRQLASYSEVFECEVKDHDLCIRTGTEEVKIKSWVRFICTRR